MKNFKKGNDLYFEVEKTKRIFIGGEAHTPINIQEIEQKFDDEFGCVRLYSSFIGDSSKNENGFKLQIRAHQSLKRGNKKKNLIATVNLSDSEIMEMAKYVIEERKKYNTFTKLSLI